METKLKAFIINTLRRASFRHKPRGEAKKLYKVKVGEFSTGRAKYGYRCLECEGVFKSGEVKMDHVNPVVCPLEGFIDFDTYILRMFCDEEGFICLCPTCHDEKTAWERDFRKRAKDLKAKDESLEILRKEYDTFVKKYLDKR